MDISLATLVVSSAALVVGAANSIQLARKHGASARSAVREDLARQAVAYAEAIGGTGPEKLRHAIEAAGKLDLADNRRRDYTDAELRVAIEAHLSTMESP